MTHAPTDYKAIALWGRHVKSYSYYILDEQARAAKENAPLDAIYRSAEAGRWITIRDLQPANPIRQQYEQTDYSVS